MLRSAIPSCESRPRRSSRSVANLTRLFMYGPLDAVMGAAPGSGLPGKGGCPSQ
jgi:hypothetical protein